MKRAFLQFITLSVLISASGLTLANEFSDLSDDDFIKMRDQVRTMDDSTKDAYRAENQSRMMNMDQSQRDARFENMGASGKKNMNRTAQKNQSRNQGGYKGGNSTVKERGTSLKVVTNTDMVKVVHLIMETNINTIKATHLAMAINIDTVKAIQLAMAINIDMDRTDSLILNVDGGREHHLVLW